MHEISCPSCNSPSQFDLEDYLLFCPFCSATFRLDPENGHKEPMGDHYIVPNTADAKMIRDNVIEWLKRMHHNPDIVEKEFFVADIRGVSVPFWIVSVDVHTVWKGLIKKHTRKGLEFKPGSDYVAESGMFRRSYRWAICGRDNICEIWGFDKLHEPKEEIDVLWDGFPLDSTMSRGRLQDPIHNEKPIYDAREFFDFKFANNIPVIGVQVTEEEGMRRSQAHISLYHWQLSKLHCDLLIDHRSDLEIAGVQLVHLPFWQVRYVYRPSNSLRYFHRSTDKHVLLDGYTRGVLRSELMIIRKDKMVINSIVSAIAGVVTILMGVSWHPAFYIVGAFCFALAGASIFMAGNKKGDLKINPTSVRTEKPVVAGGKAA